MNANDPMYTQWTPDDWAKIHSIQYTLYIVTFLLVVMVVGMLGIGITLGKIYDRLQVPGVGPGQPAGTTQPAR